MSIPDTDEVVGKKPQTLIILSQRMPVKTWRDVLYTTLNTIAEIEPEQFKTLPQTYPSFISRDGNKFQRKTQLQNGYYVYKNLSSEAICRFCRQVMDDIGFVADDWKVETD